MEFWDVWYCLRHDDGFVQKEGTSDMEIPEDSPYCLSRCKEHLDHHGRLELDIKTDILIVEDSMFLRTDYNLFNGGGGWKRWYWGNQLCDESGKYVKRPAIKKYFYSLKS